MKELEIKLTGQSVGETIVSIDNTPIKFKKNSFGSSICKYQTEKSQVNIKITRYLDVGGFVWFLTQLFFFIISIFGIFDIYYKERCLVIDFDMDIELKEENKLTLHLNSLKENSKAIDIETDLVVKEKSNNYYLDTNAKETLKKLKLTKIFLAIAIIVITAIVLIVTL